MGAVTILELADMLQEYLADADYEDLPVYLSGPNGGLIPMTEMLISRGEAVDVNPFDVIVLGS